MNDQKKDVGYLRKAIASLIGANFTPDEKPEKKKRLSKKIARNYFYRIALDLDNLKAALDMAKYPDYPNREQLYIIYELCSKDSHLASQMRTAIHAVLKSDFYLSKDEKKPDDKATEFIRTQWFNDFIAHALMAEFWGHSLIEFGQLVDGEFRDVTLFPRLNVIPEFGMVIPMPGAVKGLDYREYATQFALIEVGDPFDLGILELAAKEVIVKNYSRSDWSQSSEKFGMPRLVIRTDTQDDKEISEMEAQAANFGTNGYVILNKEDECELQSDPSTDRFKIYQENIALCDAQISKLINGQTGTSDEKSFVGSAEVHERILDDYTDARLRRMQFLVNDRLIPFLVEWGYPLKGFRFQYTDLLKKDPPTPKPTDPDGGDPSKKEPVSRLATGSGRQFPDWLMNMPAEGCCH
jgi:hypothetical protein